MEIRTKRYIRRYVSTDTTGTRRRPKLSDRDEYYYRRHAQYKRTEERRPPTYRIIETREPLRSRSNLNTLWARDESPIRSRPFKMRMPYIKRVSSAADEYEPRPRGRARSPRPFIVDPAPEIRYAWPKRERPRSPSPEIRCISPRRKSCLRKPSPRLPRSPSPRRPSPPPLRRETETVVISNNPPREGRPTERLRQPRAPRERTPVVEREPVRRRQPAVEIHQPPDRERERSRSSGRRQVRFAEDVDYVEHGSRARQRSESYPADSDEDMRERIRRRVYERNIPENLDDGSRYRCLSPERQTYRRASLRSREPEASIRPTASARSRLRPRIIQDGDRDISDAGERIYAEAHRRRYQERDLRDFVSHSSSRWRRRFDDIRDFSSDDDSDLCGMASRRYGRRWR
ncbi:hypothetical protein BDV18DRAFT_111083 [Aspergillus unguis]